MLIDRLLDNWDEFVDSTSRAGLEFKLAGAGWDEVKSLLKESVAFDCNNVSEYLKNKALDGKKLSYPNVRPCFDNMWLEWKPYLPNESEMVFVTKEGCLISSIERENHIDVYVHSFWEGSIDNNTAKPNYFGTLGWVCDNDGQLTNIITKYIDHYMEKIDSAEKEVGMIGILRKCLTLPLLTLSFLHCKNVAIHTDEPPIKLQKSRERKGKLPLITFKTLEIKPMIKILKEEGESETKGLQYALHICRGHFKDFSKGNGLFGRNKGLYWWDSQIRGHREIGAVK
jgi:hypothetical protein